VIQRVLRILEYNKIREQLISHASSSLGKQKAADLSPSFDFEDVKDLQESTDESVKVLRLKGNVPLGGIRDIRTSIKRAEIGGLLNAEELLDISSTTYAGRQFKKFILNMVEAEIEIPILEGLSKQIDPALEIEQEIRACIDDNGEILDSASPLLRTIRTQIRSYEARVREKLESIIRSSSNQKKLSDAIITIRNERFVIPVKQEYRTAFGGMIHDQSASGATLFIEPASIVSINNQLREAKGKEIQEINRILKNLSNMVAETTESLLVNVQILAEVDFIFAKARYSNALKAVRPKLNNQGLVNIKRGRHPLLSDDEVVPLNIELGNDFTSLVITGPNTGGKTVTLKTTGLLTLMAQSGLQIPADEGSEIAVFKKIFADIGDEQSIEQSLSTFSSHMTNIVQILKELDFESLVLFDELGAGTDPTEGAALAISILDYVYDRGARVIATTHYSELKVYAYNRKGVMNASVEFDVETLRPTYRLLIGIPGRSNAFEISRRIGLQPDIIESAKSQISSETNNLEAMIAALEDSQKRSERETEEAIRVRKDAEQLRAEMQKQLDELNSKRDRILMNAESKALESIEKAKKDAIVIIKELREMQQQNQPVKEHKLIEAQKRMEDVLPKLHKKEVKVHQPKKGSNLTTLKPGDEVKVQSVNQKGHIVEQISSKEYMVQIGIMKMNVAIDDLEVIKEEKKEIVRPTIKVKSEGLQRTELDLRGKRYEDAMIEVDKFLDSSIVAGFPQVSIIHGKGTGALRNGVQQLIKQNPHVKSTRFGAANEGGSGVTIAKLK
jgi:DNA mismatch repair protein MutS2